MYGLNIGFSASCDADDIEQLAGNEGLALRSRDEHGFWRVLPWTSPTGLVHEVDANDEDDTTEPVRLSMDGG